ncbi:MAG: hypothetical protein HY717_15120 [Planctomycetes bacterium]|nr:hypothetical protein [Planctomycetota bacterium]
MNAETRLAEIYEAIVGSGIRVLVMGGHAVRFYGIDRTTIDYDLHLASVDWERLPDVLRRFFLARQESFEEAQSWRPDDFRRFVIGRLPDGREEKLEFWRRNHLLAPFKDLYERRCEGLYGGKRLAFLGLKDLIQSKETEREDDWRDIELLEEIQDDRLRANTGDPEGIVISLSELRSRKGFERAVSDKFFQNPELVEEAWNRAKNPITLAYLCPYLPKSATAASIQPASMMNEIIEIHLRKTTPGSARHMALGEAVRRLYKRHAMEADRRDKMAKGPGKI